MTDPNQMNIDDCLLEDARKLTSWKDGDHPVSWPEVVADLVRIIDQLKKEKDELREAVIRQVK